ncbi:MAG: lysophospholipid acyltransferase family protein [Planctomycetota bacterium]
MNNMLLSAAGLTASVSVRSWMKTLRYRIAYHDPALDPKTGCDQPRMYVFWHEYILLPLYLRGNCDLTMLLSQHRDADVLARVAKQMGFDSVRGSTYRGSVTALRSMARAGSNRHLTITPDGPRGPRRKLAVGPIYLAAKLGMPIVPLGFGYRRPWRFRSWDRFALPRLFSQARAVVGPAVSIDAKLDRTELEQTRQSLERLLNQVTSQAEGWAEIGDAPQGTVAGRREGRLPGPAELPTLPAIPAQELADYEPCEIARRKAA